MLFYNDIHGTLEANVINIAKIGGVKMYKKEKETKLDELLQDEEITKESLKKMIEKELEKQDDEEK